MKERGIIFTGHSPGAILAGHKTKTRRAVNPQPAGGDTIVRNGSGWLVGQLRDSENAWRELRCPYGVPGDRLWVREAWRSTGDGGRCDDMPPRDLQPHEIWYEADGKAPESECVGKLRHSMFMPRWASRITLVLESVAVERLQDITEADAIAEGCAPVEAAYEQWWQGYRREFFDRDGNDVHAQATGATPPEWMDEPRSMRVRTREPMTAVQVYRLVWESLHGPGSWDLNPWVWALGFAKATPC